MAKRKKPPERMKVMVPIQVQVPVWLNTKGMTVRDLARAMFMLGLKVDFNVYPRKKTGRK